MSLVFELVILVNLVCFGLWRYVRVGIRQFLGILEFLLVLIVAFQIFVGLMVGLFPACSVLTLIRFGYFGFYTFGFGV